MYRVMLKALTGAEWQYQENVYPSYEDAAAALDNARVDFPNAGGWIEYETTTWVIAAHA